MNKSKGADPASWVRSLVEDFILNSPENQLGGPFREKAFDAPLVGFARGDDPLFDSLKEHVGPFHWTPLEIFQMSHPGQRVGAADLTVISWVLPQTRATRRDNRAQKVYPSERWARARIFGEEVNNKLRRHVVGELGRKGHQALAPVLSPEFKRVESDRFVFASTWSERHAAFVAGLGTFGLCDGLITPAGKAMRVGSVVARIALPPSSRPYTHHRQYCLFFTHGTCGKCIPRCPVGALSPSGHDKRKCLAHLRPASRDYVRAHYGFDGYGCGLCQTGVPCEEKIPAPEEGN
jgi:epoxyqueuosine reductase